MVPWQTRRKTESKLRRCAPQATARAKERCAGRWRGTGSRIEPAPLASAQAARATTSALCQNPWPSPDLNTSPSPSHEPKPEPKPRASRHLSPEPEAKARAPKPATSDAERARALLEGPQPCCAEGAAKAEAAKRGRFHRARWGPLPMLPRPPRCAPSWSCRGLRPTPRRWTPRMASAPACGWAVMRAAWRRRQGRCARQGPGPGGFGADLVMPAIAHTRS